jgi:hypothetical protein
MKDIRDTPGLALTCLLSIIFIAVVATWGIYDLREMKGKHEPRAVLAQPREVLAAAHTTPKDSVPCTYQTYHMRSGKFFVIQVCGKYADMPYYVGSGCAPVNLNPKDLECAFNSVEDEYKLNPFPYKEPAQLVQRLDAGKGSPEDANRILSHGPGIVQRLHAPPKRSPATVEGKPLDTNVEVGVPAQQDPRGWYLVSGSYLYVPHKDALVCGVVTGSNIPTAFRVRIKTNKNLPAVDKMVYGSENDAKQFVQIDCGHEAGVPEALRGAFVPGNTDVWSH